jgi:hypothetical protein
MGNSLRGRPFRDNDVTTIANEVMHLVQGGYRVSDSTQIIRGLTTALDGPTERWRRWTDMKLRNVIDELYDIGTE